MNFSVEQEVVFNSLTSSISSSDFQTLLLLSTSSDINGSPGDDGAVPLGLHVVVEVHIHFCIAAMTSVGMIRRRQRVPAASKSIVSLVFLLDAVIQVKLPPLSFIHLTTEEDVMGGRPVSGWGVMEVVVVAVGFLCQGPSGVAALPVRVHRPIVVRPSSVLAAVSRAGE